MEEITAKTQYLHESFVLRTDLLKQTPYLSDEQLGKLLKKILIYAEKEELQDTGDPLIEMVFNGLQGMLDSNWERYAKSKEERTKSGTLGGIISRLKTGIKPSEESVKFLQDNGYFTREFLKDKIPEESIKMLGL